MQLSRLFTKTKKNVAEDVQSINARLLTQAGFIRQEVAGAYTFLPLGLKVINKIEAIVREEMDKVGTEILMPALSSKDSWQLTGRLESVDDLFKASGANKMSAELNSTEYILSGTHEETLTPLIKSFRTSYKDFPFAIYQIQTKFRNEPRAKSGLLRGREFRMKDLYSFHTSEADLLKYYDIVKASYHAIFKRLGIGHDTYFCYASGGTFTSQYSNEFQTLLENGEDTIYLDRKKRIAYNKEVATPTDAKKLGVDFDKLEELKASEVGNIFPLNSKYSEAFDYKFTDEHNKQHFVFMGCYGLGTSRVMGVIAEKFADDKGLVWPEPLAPFKFHLVSLGGDKAHGQSAKVYEALGSDNCLWDDRINVSAGEKLTDSDLIGCPVRLIVSDKTLDHDSFEVASRLAKFQTFKLPLNKIGQLDSKLAD